MKNLHPQRVTTTSSGNYTIGSMWRWAVFLCFLCAAPLFLAKLGVDFSSTPDTQIVNQLSGETLTDTAHAVLRGSFTHTILEWTSVCIAAFVAFLAFVHYRSEREPTVPIIGIALFFAGSMDAFHTLTADRLIQTTASFEKLLPFTWALSRLIHACILVLGLSIVLILTRRNIKRPGMMIGATSAAFIFGAYLIASMCTQSETFPQTIFSGSIVARPFDLFPIIPFAIAGLVLSVCYTMRSGSIFGYTLILATIPNIATQLYMAFGSASLHDAYFNVAHVIKIVSYSVPLAGLIVAYISTYRTNSELARNAEDAKHKADTLSRAQADAIVHSAELMTELEDAKEILQSTNYELELQKEDAEAINAELNTINEELEVARVKATLATKAKSQFLANMSHEIRTPMTAILGFSENLRDGGLTNSEAADAIATIHKNGEYLLSIINDILDMSKVEAGKMEVEHITCSPHRVIEEVISLMQGRSKMKGLALNVEYIGSIPATIQTDPTRFKQILINIMGNAIKFTSEGGVRLIVRFVPATEDCRNRKSIEPCLQFDILDTGVGMTAEQTSNLFQAFSQADSTMTRRFGGTGLGLAISKQIAQMLGGDITIVDTEPGSGTRFRITIATGSVVGIRMINPSYAPPAQESEKPSESSDTDKPLNCRILLAEDSPDNQRLISFMLTKAGAEVTVAENGRIAFDLAMEASGAGNPFDIILMDMQMPVLDGYTAAMELRNKHYEGPIIALTAHAMASDREKCINCGCDDYASKPIDRKKLIEMVRMHTSSAAPHKHQPANASPCI